MRCRAHTRTHPRARIYPHVHYALSPLVSVFVGVVAMVWVMMSTTPLSPSAGWFVRMYYYCMLILLRPSVTANLPSVFCFVLPCFWKPLRRDRDGRREGNGTGGGQAGGREAPAEDDMSSSILDMDTSKLYAQVGAVAMVVVDRAGRTGTRWKSVFVFFSISEHRCTVVVCCPVLSSTPPCLPTDLLYSTSRVMGTL